MDASEEQQQEGEKLLDELYDKLTSTVAQRVESTILREELGRMQEAVIIIRPTKVQLKLYNALNRFFKRENITNFLEQYAKTFLVSNHPGILIEALPTKSAFTKAKESQNHQPKDGDMISDEEQVVQQTSTLWWDKVYKENPKMADICHGNKMVLLIQILAQAESIGDKVVVFSQSLDTLNFIEKALQKPDWSMMVPKITDIDGKKGWGNWEKNRDYLRIDGSVMPKKRGELIDQFNDKDLENINLFLLSSRAGNVGINLVGANRVVMFDSHWNPTVHEQAIHRCYRYGQEKAVFVYRFVTEGMSRRLSLFYSLLETFLKYIFFIIPISNVGTIEEKIYSRCVNKSGLAARVIDQKNPKRNFSKRDTENLMEVDNWVQCNECEKWRMLPTCVNPDDLPEEWFCEMNIHDPDRASCSAKERSKNWYHKHYHEVLAKNNQDTDISPGNVPPTPDASGIQKIETKIDDSEKEQNTRRDVILSTLLENSKSVISKYHFHESMLKSNDIKLK